MPSTRGGPLLSIVIPIYNERGTWRELLRRVEAVDLGGWRREVLLVDDGSTDGTREELAALPAGRDASGRPGDSRRVLYHPANRGKGAALHTGFAAAGGHVVLVQDADLEYDPRDIPRLLAALVPGGVAVVYGSRFARGRRPPGSLASLLANRFLTMLSNLLTGQRLTDMETCYKVFRREVLAGLDLRQGRFGFEPELTVKLGRRGIPIREVPIRYAGRSYAEGKKIGWRDGLQAVGCILWYALGERVIPRRRGASRP
jgi:glycosyltransferase involved in cell wall biosynthesis